MLHHLNLAPSFEGCASASTLSTLYGFYTGKNHSDRRHWYGELTCNEDGSIKKQASLNAIEIQLLRNEAERIMVMSREDVEAYCQSHEGVDAYFL